MGAIRHNLGRAYRKVRPKEISAQPKAVHPAEQYPTLPIGKHTYGDILVIRDYPEHTLRIGDYCSLGEGATFWVGGGHRTDWVTTYPFNALDPQFSHITGHPVSRGDIELGGDVWVGYQALILSGVKIGSGAVIGARAVVTKDVEPYTIVAGSPAKPIRKRFDDATIERLLEIAWWDWDEESVNAAVPLLQSDDIQAFIRAVDEGKLPLKK